ncbi:hypothetical protein GC197_10340 [bacterium]|nr:hypothetical protein [bacterium]
MNLWRFSIGVFALASWVGALEAAEPHQFQLSGMRITGQVVQVTKDDVVIIRKSSSNEHLAAPIDSFGPADQQYIRDQQKIMEESAGPEEVRLFAPREWTDLQGRTIRASFARMNGSNVVLHMDPHWIETPYFSLSKSDRAFLEAGFAQEGHQDWIPRELYDPSKDTGLAGQFGQPAADSGSTEEGPDSGFGAYQSTSQSKGKPGINIFSNLCVLFSCISALGFAFFILPKLVKPGAKRGR